MNQDFAWSPIKDLERHALHSGSSNQIEYAINMYMINEDFVLQIILSVWLYLITEIGVIYYSNYTINLQK